MTYGSYQNYPLPKLKVVTAPTIVDYLIFGAYIFNSDGGCKQDPAEFPRGEGQDSVAFDFLSITGECLQDESEYLGDVQGQDPTPFDFLAITGECEQDESELPTTISSTPISTTAVTGHCAGDLVNPSNPTLERSQLYDTIPTGDCPFDLATYLTSQQPVTPGTPATYVSGIYQETVSNFCEQDELEFSEPPEQDPIPLSGVVLSITGECEQDESEFDTVIYSLPITTIAITGECPLTMVPYPNPDQLDPPTGGVITTISIDGSCAGDLVNAKDATPTRPALFDHSITSSCEHQI